MYPALRPVQASASFFRGRRRNLATLAVLAVLGSMLGHELTYLLSGGPAVAYRAVIGSATHGGYWLLIAAVVLTMAAGVLGIGFREMRRLRARRSRPLRRGRAEGPSFLGLVAGLWVRLAFATTVVYVTQENVESAMAATPVPGLDALLTHGLLPLGVIAVVTLAVSVVAGLLRWGHAILVSRATSQVPDQHPRAARPSRRLVDIQVASSFVPGGLSIRGPPRIRTLTS